MSLPAEDRVRGGVPKELLNEAVHEWDFGAPVDEVIRVLEKFCLETDLLVIEGIRRLHGQGAGVSLLPLYNLAMWWRTFIASQPPLEGVV
jgi:hypothetical protein